MYVNTLINYAGVQLPQLLLMAIALLTVLFVTYKGVQLSTNVMLTIEAIAVTLIVIMGIIILIDHGLNFGPQLALQGVGFQYNTLGLGLVMAFFSFIGFESATAMGEEAKDPLHTIPKAIMGSGIFSGIFFLAMSLIMVMGFSNSATPLANNASPFTYLANQAHVGIFGILIAIGAIVSIWSCACASIQASARMLMTMSKKGQLPAVVSKTHQKNSTPYVAILICCVFTVLPLLLLLCGNHVTDIYNWTITLCGLGFLVSYILISVGAPIYLSKLKELNTGSVVVAVLALLMLVIPIIGSFYPVPPYPLTLLPYVFLGWLIISGIWYLIVRKPEGKNWLIQQGSVNQAS
jgi:amino acid transporter